MREMHRQSQILFEDSAIGVVRKWNERIKGARKNPKLVGAEYVAVMAAAARVAGQLQLPSLE